MLMYDDDVLGHCLKETLIGKLIDYMDFEVTILIELMLSGD